MNEKTTPASDMEAIIKAIREGNIFPQFVGAPDTHPVPFAVIPKDCQVASLKEFVNPNSLPKSPRKGCVTFYDPNSFAEWVNQFKDPRTQVFAADDGKSILAIFDYHPKAKHETVTATHQADPDEGERLAFRAKLNISLDQAAEGWIDQLGEKMNPVQFAEFLEDRHLEVRVLEADDIDLLNTNGSGRTYDYDAFQGQGCSGGDLQKIALTLRANPNVAFESATNLQNGDVGLRFNREANLRGGATGELEIPSTIYVRTPLYQGADDTVLEIRVRTRFDHNTGLVSFRLRPLYLERILRSNRDALRVVLADAIGQPIFQGFPEE